MGVLFKFQTILQFNILDPNALDPIINGTLNFLTTNWLVLIIVPVVIGITIFTVIFLRRKKKETLPTLLSKSIDNPVVLEIQVPRNLEVTVDAQNAPMAAEQMFASLHGLLRDDPDLQEHFTFEIVSSVSGIRFYTVVPAHIVKFVESQVYAQYPTAHIDIVEDYVMGFSEDTYFEVGNLTLSKSQIFPLKTFRDFEVDPLSAITSTLSDVTHGDSIWLQFIVRPIPDVWQEEGHEYIDSVVKGTSKARGGNILEKLLYLILDGVLNITYAVLDSAVDAITGRGATEVGGARADAKEERITLTSGQELEIKSIEHKMSKMGFEVGIRMLTTSKEAAGAKSRLRSVIASMRQFSTANLNSFVENIDNDQLYAYEKFKHRIFVPERSFVLNIEEMASIFHLPSSSVETPNISWVYSKKGEAPADLPIQTGSADITYLGETTFRNKQLRFGLRNDNGDRLRHMYLIGKTGAGKSTLFKTLISQDIYNGQGVGVLDPHGELIDDILEMIPDHRLDDVILVDPSDTKYPVGINLLELDDPSKKNIMASGLVSAIKMHFEFSWGPRLEYLLNYAILTLIEVPGTSMLGIVRLLTDLNYQKYILHYVKDPIIMEFWEKEFKDMRGNQRLITEAVAPIQNKINRFLASTTIRNILGQRNSTVDFWDAMNTGKIVLMNLSKGKIGEDNANLLGALLVSRIQFMALQRATIPPEERRPFYLYVDEFQNFASGTFESILSESRKYGLGLYLTHQYTSQLPENLLAAVFGNVGTIAAFGLGAPDAKVLQNEFAPIFSEQDLISLERFHIYIKLMVDGMTSAPFSAKILRPWIPEETIAPHFPNNKEKVIAKSRETYGTELPFVEKKIKRWIERDFDKGMAIAEEMRIKKEKQKRDRELKRQQEQVAKEE